ncbi:MAG: isopentenyl transferase family protein [Sulfurovum sp.]|nr:isopentenyl transferase family protein [Sulfurovum sp.]
MIMIKQLAIIGATASGKTSLAIALAHKMNAYILSLDSLSVYHSIDIASAKPSLEEREGIVHFGIDTLYPHENFDVTHFITLYHQVYAQCIKEQKNLILVGGTSFYLKMLIEGISPVPSISAKTQKSVETYMRDIPKTYAWLLGLDAPYMSAIASQDAYRIEKALQIYLETSLTPTAYFVKYPPQATISQAIAYLSDCMG